jgi:hypothetical protein
MGYVLWTPYRKNMEVAKNGHQSIAIKRTVENDFSLLNYYNRARSLAGFQ